jgi:predicted nuclease with TOPRIM domain
MTGTTRTILCLSVCAIVTLLAGCDEGPVASQKQERLYAAENMELKKQIASLQEKSAKELAAKQQELDKCNQDKTTLNERLNENTRKAIEQSLMPTLMERVHQLTDENTHLKSRIKELEKQVGGSEVKP